MNRQRKIASGILSGVLAASMTVPAFAANDTASVIDYDRKGTLNIHKILDNDGNTEVAYGLANPDETRVPVDNIGFDYVHIAEIENVAGIIISDADGYIDYDADGGMTQVGAYYIPNEKFKSFIEDKDVAIFPHPTYIKNVTNEEDNSIQYEWADHKANSLLAAQSDAVRAAKADLDAKRAAKIAADNEAASKTAAYNTANEKDRQAQAALTAANTAAYNANQRLLDAVAQENTARTNWNDAVDALNAANTALNSAQATFDEKLTTEHSYAGVLRNTQAALKSAQQDVQSATQDLTDAQAEKDFAASNLTQAQAAFEAAQNILTEAQKALEDSQTGTPISETGTTNAVAYATQQLANAQAYLDQCRTADTNAGQKVANAETALTNANTALNTAREEMNAATNRDDAAYNELKTAFNALTAAISAVEEATNTVHITKIAYDKAQALKEAAQTNANTAQAALNAAQANATTAGNNKSAAATAQANAIAAQTTANNNYVASFNAYIAAVKALDDLAAANGIVKVYTAQEMQEALQALITRLSEEKVSQWVLDNTSYTAANAGKYTDDRGVVCFSGMALGLYLVAETDISYHDGYAGAWNDKASGGFINNDQMNTYDGAGNYHITPVDSFGNAIGDGNGINGASMVRDYQRGELYKESVNPEAPVIETPAAPFLVSLPFTNVENTEGKVAAGDNSGQIPGSVWQYTADVYPKNQSTAIYKRIIDPDELFENETLRTSEDYQIGDKIQEVIWADAPKLQKNYLDLDHPENGNKHIGYAISNTMTEGITVDPTTDIKKVVIIPKSQLISAIDEGNANGINKDRTVFTNPEGTYIVDYSEATRAATAADKTAGKAYKWQDGLLVKDANGTIAMETRVKYFDQNDHEISLQTFMLRTGKGPFTSASTSDNFKSDIDNNGEEQANGTKTWPAINQQTGTYYATRVSYKFNTIPSASSTIPTKVNALLENTRTGDTSIDLLELTPGTDYTVIDTTTTPVLLHDGEGKEKTVVEAGTNGFTVKLTEEGLAKLDARSVDSVVAVYFDGILNEDAKIGQQPENSNYPSLHWANTNTSVRSISGNTVYAYTYELRIKKEGISEDIEPSDGNDNFAKVKFIVSRDDTGDIAQAPASNDLNTNKDMTDMVARERFYGQDDSMRFVKESDGVYHFFNNDGEVEKGELVINGMTQLFNYVSPSTTEHDGIHPGDLIIKGLDSDSYIFKEIQTEEGKNLLADTFTVKIEAKDDALDSLRDGAIASATVTTQNPEDKLSGDSIPVDITIGLTGIDGQDGPGLNNLGIAGMKVTNNDVIDLRTGGKGRIMIYIAGVALLGAATVGIYATKKREMKDEA